jgi:hypothetical protein
VSESKTKTSSAPYLSMAREVQRYLHYTGLKCMDTGSRQFGIAASHALPANSQNGLKKG